MPTEINATSIVEIKSHLLGLLFQNGRFVRIAKVTIISERTDSRNQAVWNNSAPAPKTNKIKAIVITAVLQLYPVFQSPV